MFTRLFLLQTGPNGPPTPGSRPDQVSSSSNGSNEVGGGPQLKCTNCRGKLEDTHFVQCPSNITHKFCFACCRDSIIKQGSEVIRPGQTEGNCRAETSLSGFLSEWREMSAAGINRALGLHAGGDRDDPRREI